MECFNDFSNKECIKSELNGINYILLDMEMIQTSKDHACIRKFYALSKDGKRDIEIECIQCKRFRDLDEKYQKAFIYCKKKIHHLRYYPTQQTSKTYCRYVKHILKNFMLEVNADIIFYKGGIYEKNLSSEMRINSFNIEKLGVQKVDNHDPKTEIHAHFKQLQDIIHSY